MSNDKTRYALISTDNLAAVERYLPGNYSVLVLTSHEGRPAIVIQGRDNAGWTLDDYVLPRLASGLYFGKEIDLSHPTLETIVAEVFA